MANLKMEKMNISTIIDPKV